MFPHQWLARRICPGKILMALAAAALLASGCASPDEPTARRVIIPQAVQDLQAWQQGGTVILSFTLPNQTTRKEPLEAAPAIEIYRGESAPGSGAKSPTKTPMKAVYTIPSEMVNSYRADGKIVYRDEIDAAELARVANGAGAERVYLVRTRAARNRASMESNRVVVRIHPAPGVVSNVSAKASGQSVTVNWPREAAAGYRVYRAEIAPESAAEASADASKAVLRMPLVQVAQMDASANGGTPASLQYQDENVVLGHTYLYIVRRVAQFGVDTVESADSKASVITVVEVVPPTAPQDVEAVVVPASANEPAYVSLSWAIGSEPSVAGYAVYRSEQEGVRGARLNDELTGAPTYRDATVAAGRRYFYSVTAVDGGGRESAPSPAVEAQIPVTQP